ncbi:MAG: hypothetical protein AUJ97_03390 [Bacteroidetes bacterium CG2_30_32_10]|nr:MAG: hypothetical protein AUJ97_03390 [Bacteroidetes bacterium CG2_30_32_10]
MDSSTKAKNKITIQSGSYNNNFEKILIDTLAFQGYDFFIIGKGINVLNNTIIDFLAIDKNGQLMAFIKSMDSEHFLEKHLDITLWLDKLSLQTINSLCENIYHRPFEQLFKEKFQTSYSNVNDEEHFIILVTAFIEEQTEAIMDKLIHHFKIPINALILEHIKNDQEEYVLQSWFTAPTFKNNATKSAISSWDNSYSLDIPIIDRQHKMFFKIYDELLKNDPASISDAQKLYAIEQLKDYVLGHFQTEELLIKRAKYNEADQHIQQHKMFINKTNEFRQSFDYKNTQLVNQMLVFIRKWFLSHIAGSDAQYKTQVLEYIQHL